MMKKRDINCKKMISEAVGSLKTANSYLVLGPVEEIYKSLVGDINSLDLSTAAPDQKNGSISIKNIRNLISEVYNSPNGKYRLAVVMEADRLNHASSNALLKTLEEPPERTKIVLLSETDQLLDTIKSRCRLIDLRGQIKTNNTDDNEDVEKILNGNINDAFNIVEEVVKKESEDKFMYDLQMYAYRKMLNKKEVIWSKKLGKIIEIREDIKKNANKKMALENLMIHLIKNK